jgi:hypothetical protein
VLDYELFSLERRSRGMVGCLMRTDSKTVSTLIGVVVLIAGVYIAWKLLKALGFVLIAVGLILIAARVFRK